MDPHITQYSVYITDNYTGNTIKKNVTETQFTFNIQQDDGLCPMYQVSAWNAGGEGELSEPVQESTPQGKQAKATSFFCCYMQDLLPLLGMRAKNFLTGLLALHHISFLLFCISISVPRNVLVESITVRGTVTTNVVHIHINNVSSRILYTSIAVTQLECST